MQLECERLRITVDHRRGAESGTLSVYDKVNRIEHIEVDFKRCSREATYYHARKLAGVTL